MSNQTSSEGHSNSTENSEKLETLQAQLAELTQKLEAEKSTKERLLEESKKYKEGYQTFKTKQQEIESQKAQEEEERLRKEGQFQTLLEQREKRLKELEESLKTKEDEVKSRDTAITNFRKASAFERELGGKLRKQDYWKHVDFDSIAINPESGEIDKDSLSSVAQSFTKEYKELVDFGANANLPNGTANGKGSTSLTYEQWQKLPLKDRKKRMKDVKN
jgi:DNA repair exonuclease SbcCD ATPase subunit